MDWITTALNEPAARSTDLSSKDKEGDDCNKPPNFDQFLNRRQQQQPDQGQRGQPDQGSNLNNARSDGKAGFSFNSASTAGSSFGNVRIHQTEMQRYLQGLMNSQNNPSSMPMPMNSNDPNSKAEMLQQLKNLGGGGDPNVIGDSSLPKGNGNGGSSSNNNAGGGGGMGLLAAAPLPPPEKSDKVSSSRQKNDKAVEVHHERAVIARFRTQTECARYLRATPEAVSYHCSRGGGVCNGLVIKSVDAAEVDRLLATERQTENFGLFEGAVRHRPKERPQLKPETVAILKDWLLSPDNMDNPYPNQREREMLMEKTGLDKTQLKHWFNNARKRILKPLLKKGGKKPLVPPRKREHARKRGNSSDSLESRKKRRSNFDLSVCGAADPNDANKISNASYEERQRRQHQLLIDERQRVRPGQFDDPFMNGGGCNYGDDGNNMMSNMMSMNQYDQLMGFNNGGLNKGMGNMMGYGGMMDRSFNGIFNGGRWGFQGRRNMGGDPSGPSNAAIADDSARTNAFFKQEIATMAMSEASAAFKDMEDACAHAKWMLAAARAKRAVRSGGGAAEDNPIVAEANARAKKCQSVARFKLKVCQRASKEAANAYDGYQRMVEEMGRASKEAANAYDGYQKLVEEMGGGGGREGSVTYS